jgi:hypothetical protein
MTTTEMGSVQSPAAENAGGPNTVILPPDGRLERSALASVFGQLEATADGNQTSTATDAAPDSNPDAATPQTDLGSDVGPESAAAETADTTGGDGNDLSQSSSTSVASDPEVQKHLTELSEALARGEISIGELKRINKAVHKARDAEGQLESLRAEVEALKTARTETPPATPATPEADNPFGNLKSDEDVRRMTREMHDLLDWAEDYPDGGVRKGKEFSADEVRLLRKEARRALDLHLPAQRERLVAETQLAEQRQQSQQWMRQNFPSYTDPENAMARRAKELLAGDPLLRRYPNADYLALALVKGDEALRAELAARQKPAAKPAPKPAVPSAKPNAAVTSGGGPRPAGADSKLQSAKQMVEKDRSRSALANYLTVVPGAAGKR